MSFNYSAEWYAAQAVRERSRQLLSVYVITYGTADFPGLYAVRRHEARDGRSVPCELVGTAETLAEARQGIPFGLSLFMRAQGDESVIVESWL